MNITSDYKINKVFGGLLGQNMGNKSEIFSSFEFFNESEDDSLIKLDLSYIDERRKLTEQLYPNYELLGFFLTSTNKLPESNDVEELVKVMDYFGVVSPLCLVLSTDLTNAEELPLAIYRVDKNKKRVVKLDHLIEGHESERICLDTITKSTDLQNNESAVIQNMVTLKNAVDVLKANLKLIKGAISDKKFYNDPNFIIMVDELVNNYPNVCSQDLIEMLNKNEEEILLLNNISSNSVNISLQGRLETFNNRIDHSLFKNI
jgi:hypothetical protein